MEGVEGGRTEPEGGTVTPHTHLPFELAELEGEVRLLPGQQVRLHVPASLN